MNDLYNGAYFSVQLTTICAVVNSKCRNEKGRPN